MAKHNLVYVFIPKGLAGDVRRSITQSLREAQSDLARTLRGKSYNSKDLLTQAKKSISAKLQGLPFQFRIATVEGIEYNRGIAGWIAEKILSWDKRVEEFIVLEFPYFHEVRDPIEVKVGESEIEFGGGNIFTLVGFYETFGTTGATILIGGGTALLTLLICLAANVDWKTTLLVTLLAGGAAAITAYFTGVGVEKGIPIGVKK